jgi:hypothetical protein
VTSGHASDRAGLHRRQLGAFVIEPANFGKGFDVPPAALECVLMSTGRPGPTGRALDAPRDCAKDEEQGNEMNCSVARAVPKWPPADAGSNRGARKTNGTGE